MIENYNGHHSGQQHSSVAVREFVSDLRECRTSLRWGTASDLALAPVFDEDRVWELIAARVGDTVAPPIVGTLSRFLG